jgi:DNA-binding CsgD family transcriptional regulator
MSVPDARLGFPAAAHVVALTTAARCRCRRPGSPRPPEFRVADRAARRLGAGWDSLTDAEIAVVELIAAGESRREVAERLFLYTNTVNTHLRHVFVKLNVHSSVELAREVLEHGAARQPTIRHRHP